MPGLAGVGGWIAGSFDARSCIPAGSNWDDATSFACNGGGKTAMRRDLMEQQKGERRAGWLRPE